LIVQQSLTMKVSVGLGIWVSLLLFEAYGQNPHNASRLDRSRIIKGREVKPHTFPWQVGLYDNDWIHSFCGGTIICPKFILTAGHCVEHHEPWELYIIAGDHNQTEVEAFETRHEVMNISIHEDYKYVGCCYGLHENDYAILELKNPIQLRKEARPLFLPQEHEHFDGETLFVASGWGRTSAKSSSDVLKSTTLHWMKDDKCERRLQELLQLPFRSSMICAGGRHHGHQAQGTIYNGDSGGPLAWLDEDTEQIKIIGIPSFVTNTQIGGPQGIFSTPQVFARVQWGIDWINKITKNCNYESCLQGNCMTKDDLDPDALERFQHL